MQPFVVIPAFAPSVFSFHQPVDPSFTNAPLQGTCNDVSLIVPLHVHGSDEVLGGH